MSYIKPGLLRDAISLLNKYHENTFLLLVFSLQSSGSNVDLKGNGEAVRAVFDTLFPATKIGYMNRDNTFIQLTFNGKKNTPTVKLRPVSDYGKSYQRTIKDTFANNGFLIRIGEGTYNLTTDFVEKTQRYLKADKIDLRPLVIFEHWNKVSENTSIGELWNPFAVHYNLDKPPFDSIFYCSQVDDIIEIADNSYSFDEHIKVDDSRIKGVEVIDVQAEEVAATDKQTSSSIINGLHNKIFYGAPGTGKSRMIDNLANGFSQFSRVTFHPDYTYNQFVGGYKPRSLYDNYSLLVGTPAVEVYQTITPIVSEKPYKRRPVIDYTVVPGPFLSLLIQAYKNPDKNHLLIIEEINRANAAAVFGDIFQLLDRDEDGVSEYAVTLSVELSNWLLSQGCEADGELVEDSGDGLSIRLPGNFYLWATMNSADQGVMPLDSAFKRRWSFEYIPLNKEEKVIADWKIKLLGREISWNGLRNEINSFLMTHSGSSRGLVSEDKLLGPFFMKKQELSDDWVVLNKLLLYLRDDLVRHNANIVFAVGAMHFSAVYEIYKDVLEVYNPPTDSQALFNQDLNRVFIPQLALRIASLYPHSNQGTTAVLEPVT